MAEPHPSGAMDASIDVYGGYAVGWTFCSVTALLMVMRVFTVLFVSKSKDGYWPLFWAIIGFIMALSEQIINTRAVQNGLGNHLLILLKAGKVDDFLYWTYMSVFFFLMNIGLGKIVGCSFLLALHTDTHPKRRALLHFVWASNTIFGLPAIFLLWFRCSPPSAMFVASEQSRCSQSVLVEYAQFLTAWSALSDLVMSLIPIFLVWPLQMKIRLKLVVCFLMGLGVFAAISSIMVAANGYRLLTVDASYDSAVLIMWGKATCWLVLISASVPPIWPLLKFLHDKALSIPSRSRSRTDASHHGGAGGATQDKSKRSSFIRLEEGVNRSTEWPPSADHMEVMKQVQVTTHMEHTPEQERMRRELSVDGFGSALAAPAYGQGRAYSPGWMER